MTYQLQCEGFEQKLKNHVEASLAAAAANFSREPFTGTGGGRGRDTNLSGTHSVNSINQLLKQSCTSYLDFCPTSVIVADFTSNF